MKQYYFHDGKNQVGPLPIEEVIKQITPNTLIWHEGLVEWESAKNLEEFKDYFKSTPPPISFNKSSTPQVPSIPKIKRSKFLYVTIISSLLLLILWFAITNYNDKKEAEKIIEQNHNEELKREYNEKEKLLAEEQKKEQEKNKAIEEDNAQYQTRNNASQNFRFSSSNYTVKPFGGISDLNITFTNNSKYKLEEFSVSVDYILANGGIHATDIVSAFNLNPGEKRIVPAPGATRGSSVRINYHKIVGRSFNFLIEKDYFSGKKDDPYFKKD